MRVWGKDALLNLVCATAFAAWCCGWLWLLLEATVPYPGIFTLQGHRGAYEMLERFSARPGNVVLAAFFLLAMLPPFLLGMARNWLDPDREGTRALCWSFGSRSLNTVFAAGLLLVLAAMLLSQEWVGDDIGVIASAAVGLVGIIIPFFAWNRHTLWRQALERWWSPAWPGRTVVLAAIVLLGLSAAIGFGVELLEGSVTSIGMSLSILAAEWLLDFFIWLLLAVIWLNHGYFHAARADLSRVPRWPVLGPLLWQDLLLALLTSALLWPAVISAVLAIFVVPQYAAWAQSHGENLSTALSLVAAVGRNSNVVIGMLAPALGMYWLLALGRLLVRRGIGT